MGEIKKFFPYVKSSTAAFVIPLFNTGNPEEYIWLNETLKSIECQTDDDWIIIIVDDSSPDKKIKDFFQQFKKKYNDKIELIILPKNKGPGNARNVGIKRAYELGCPFILYLDSDDTAHPERLAVTRKIFSDKPLVGVVYSSFEVIDEYGNYVDEKDIIPSILEIIEQHRNHPLQGRGVWLKIALETGYINLTSATSVRTELAYEYPFPIERVSEDYYTWLVYSASGWEYAYSDIIPAKYRIPREVEGSRTRSMLGGQHNFNMIKSIVDVRGFQAALDLACISGEISESMKDELLIRFFLIKSKSMKRDGENDIAMDYYRRAYEIDKQMAYKIQCTI